MIPVPHLAYVGLAVLAVVCARTQATTQRDAVIHAARCRVRCLSLLSSKRPGMDLVSAFTGFKLSRWPTFAQCIDDTNCTACLRPCTQPFVNLNLCQSICESDTESCQLSCSYLKEISTTRPGQCPVVNNEATIMRTVAPCVANCGIDIDCRHNGKCCEGSCGKTCRKPLDRFEGVPAIPESPHIRERPKGGVLEVTWTGALPNFSLPVVYIVESRWTVGAQHSEMPFTHWQQISQTTTHSAIVHDATPGHWYQFRVSAVSTNGCMGPSTETDPFKLSREARPPSQPRNLTQGDTIITNRQMSVTIHWRAPRKSDLPISKYKLFWSAQMGDELLSSQILAGAPQEHRKVLKGNFHKYELPDLIPDTTYFIQVQAICKYGDSKLKSVRSNIYIHTAQPWPEELEPTPAVVVRPLPPPAPLRDLTVHKPFFQNGLLKTNVTWRRPLALHNGEAPVDRVVVEWKPHACISSGSPDNEGQSTTLSPKTLTALMTATTRDSFYIMYDLRFDCQLYRVKVWPVSADSVRGTQANVTFAMPECKDITVLGDLAPDCPTGVGVPAEPPYLEHSFVSRGENISVRLSWHTPRSHVPITDYRVEWGKVIQGQEKPLPESTLTKVLPKEVHSFSIESLQSGAEYMVRVQALIIKPPRKVTPGQVATLRFRTPVMKSRHIDPPYQHSNVKVASKPDAIEPSSPHSVRSIGADTSSASRPHTKHTLVSFVFVAMTIDILFCIYNMNAQTGWTH